MGLVSELARLSEPAGPTRVSDARMRPLDPELHVREREVELEDPTRCWRVDAHPDGAQRALGEERRGRLGEAEPLGEGASERHRGFVLALALESMVKIVAFLAVALFAVVALSRRGSRLSAPPSWPFALMPLVGFPVQEHAERWLHTGAFPQDAASSRLFVLGLVLQLPFALVGWLAARWLFAVARSVGLALTRESFAVATVVASLPHPHGIDRPQPLGASLGGLGSRAPPCCS